MNPTFYEYSRRAILPFIGLLMVAYYLMVFLPLNNRSDALDKPLESAWRKLAASVGQTNATGLDFEQIRGQLDETKRALGALSATQQRVVARLQLAEELRERMSTPFRLVDYRNEVSLHADEITQRASLRKIQVAPEVLDGYPEYRTDVSEPALLWAALQMAEDLVDTAIACNVSAINTLEVPVNFTNAIPTEHVSPWVELSANVEFTATTAAAAQVLQMLPLRADELKPAGLPELSGNKMVCFVDRLVLKRQAPEKTDEVRLWLRAVSFVKRDQ